MKVLVTLLIMMYSVSLFAKVPSPPVRLETDPIICEKCGQPAKVKKGDKKTKKCWRCKDKSKIKESK